MKAPRQQAGRQRPQRNTLSPPEASVTLRKYPIKDITEKIISCVQIYQEGSFATWNRSILMLTN
jgi:hypothetical protein